MPSRYLLVLLACLIPVLPGHGDPVPDPVPLRRILVPADQVPAEMERAGVKKVVQLPRAEFEELVRAAARAVEAGKKAPRVVETHYRARLVDADLVGSGRWTVHAANDVSERTPAVLPLPNLNIALRQPRFENRDALVGDFDGKNLGLLLDKPGEQTVAVEWSARGERQSAGLSFDLELPRSPVATLELELPKDRVVTVSSEGAVVSGPTPAEAESRRLWKISFRGVAQVHLTLRTVGEDDAPPPVFTTLKTTQDLRADRQDVEFEFDVRVPSGGLRELRCEFDPVLRPTEVSVSGLESWHVRETDLGGNPGQLLIKLREPFLRGTLQVRCTGPLTAENEPTWASPWMRLAGAVPRREDLTLRVQGDLRLEDWRPGGFLLTGSQFDRGVQILTLTGGSLEPAGRPRPAARIRGTGGEWLVRQQVWWQLTSPRPAGGGPTEAVRSVITAQMTFEPVRGSLFQIAVNLPPDYEVERVQLTPAEHLRHWTVRNDPEAKNRPTLFLDLQKPLTAGGPSRSSVSLTLGLRPRKPIEWVPGGPTLTFPDLSPRGTRLLDGGLGVEVEESMYDAVLTTTAEASAPPTDSVPWGRQVPDYYFASRGQPVQGRLRLLPRRPGVRVRGVTELAVEGPTASVKHHITVQPEVGQPRTIDLLLTAPVPDGLKWKASADVKVEPLTGTEVGPALLPLAARSAVQAAVLVAASDAAVRAGATWWRVTLAEPLREALTLETTYPVKLSPEGTGPPDYRLAVPLPRVPAATQFEGEVKLTLPGAQLNQVEAVGLRETTPSGGSGSVKHSPWRVFRYGHELAGLSLRVRARPGNHPTPALIDRADFASAPEFDGHITHRLWFRVWQWPEETLTVGLPPDAEVESVWVDGRRLSDARPTQLLDGVEVRVPIPPGRPDHSCEVVYHERRAAWFLAADLSSPLPALPVEPLSLHRSWRLPPGVVPLSERQWQPAGTREMDTWWDWLFRPLDRPQPHELAAAPSPPVMVELAPDWVAWEPGPSGDAAASMVVVRRDGLSGGGVILALMLLVGLALFGRARRMALAQLRTPRRSRRRLAFLLGWLAVSALAVMWLPEALRDVALAPLAVAAALALGWYLLSATRPLPPLPRPDPSSLQPGRTARKATGVAVLLLICLAGLVGHAAGPDATPVFIVGDDPDRQTVFAPTDLVDQLRAQANGKSGSLEPTLISAVYEGTATDAEAARFEATFRAQSFSADAVTLHLPLTGVQIEEVLCDGAVVNPTSPRPPADAPPDAPPPGLGVVVKGVGPHTVIVRFRVPTTATGDDREIQFTAPRLSQSRLSLTVPKGATFVQCPLRLGATRFDPAGPRLDVDLGRLKLNLPIQVRWRQANGPPVAPEVNVRELYLWELGVSSSTLTGLLHYAVARSAVSSLEVDLPSGLEVQALDVTAPRDGISPPLPGRVPRLKDWQVTPAGGRKRLRLEFQSPVSTGVIVRLEAIPVRPFGTRDFALPVPVPVGAKTTEGWLAFRGVGLQAAFNDRSEGVAYRAPAEFVALWRQVGGQGLPALPPGSIDASATPGYACFFRRDTPPTLLVRLALPPAAADGTLDAVWRLRPGQADLSLRTVLTATTSRPVALVEWDVPEAVTVAEVSGPEVRAWGRAGSRVQAWLQWPTTPQVGSRSAEVTLKGWWAAPPGPMRPLAPVPRPQTWDLPRVALANVARQKLTLRLQPEPGLALDPVKESLQNVTVAPVSGTGPLGGDLVLTVARPEDYSGVIRLRQAPPGGAPLQALTIVEMAEGQVAFKLRLVGRVPGDDRLLAVRLRNWEGDAVRLAAGDVARVREESAAGGERVWRVELKSGGVPSESRQVDMTLTATIPADRLGGGMSLPDVGVDVETGGVAGWFSVGRNGAPLRAERWVAVVGPGLVGQAPHRLEPVADVEALSRSWPELKPKGSKPTGSLSAWKVVADGWSLRLAQWGPAASAGRPGLRVLLIEQQLSAEGGGWSHQATCWLHVAGSTDLQVTLPPGAALKAATVDGEAAMPLASGGESWWLPLPGGAGPRRVRLRWTGPDGETTSRPDLTVPRLGTVADGGPVEPTAVVWEVALPRGYHVTTTPRPSGAQPASPVDVELRRAEAQLRTCEAVLDAARLRGDRATGLELAPAQKRFALATHRARSLLQGGPVFGSGPRGQGLGEWLEELEEANRRLAREEGFESVREAAESEAKAATEETAEPFGEDAPTPGLTVWHAEGVTPPPVAPRSEADLQGWRSLAISGLLLAVLLTAWVLSFAPGMLGWARAFWPEQLILLACLTWQTAGLNVLVLLLAGVGVVGRVLLLLGQGVSWLLGRPEKKSPESAFP